MGVVGTAIEGLFEYTKQLHKDGAYHKKRGFSLHNVPLGVSTNHLIEESVELQAEVLYGDTPKQLEEAADVLCCYFHVLIDSGLSPADVAVRAREKLESVFTLDKSEVLTNNPGYTRNNRING